MQAKADITNAYRNTRFMWALLGQRTAWVFAFLAGILKWSSRDWVEIPQFVALLRESQMFIRFSVGSFYLHTFLGLVVNYVFKEVCPELLVFHVRYCFEIFLLSLFWRTAPYGFFLFLCSFLKFPLKLFISVCIHLCLVWEVTYVFSFREVYLLHKFR